MKRQADLLRGVCLLGLAVFLVLLGALVYLALSGGIPLFSPAGLRRTSFALALAEYDRRLEENPGLPPKERNVLLDSLEKKALDTENTLSVLKRRRAAVLSPVARDREQNREQYLASYRKALKRVREDYPHSAQIAALGAEALILVPPSSPAPNEEEAAELRSLAGLMSEGALEDLSLAFYVYSGAMEDPAVAVQIPRKLFILLCSLVQGEERERYLVNAAIRTLLGGEVREAIAMTGSLFDTPPLRDETIRFGAEFFYDHGNFLRSAELFSAFTDSRSLARQADAQWLAGFSGGARGLWQIAAVETAAEAAMGTGEAREEAASVRSRAFYNLASTAGDPAEAERSLERLFALNAAYAPGRTFGIIRYSRLVPLDRALAILGQTGRDQEGLFDLEFLRRQSENWTVDRTVAETWLLLNRHPGDGRLFEWAVWYFDFQRRYDETARALRNAGINRVEGPWSALHRAFAQVREGALEEAEKTLRSIVRAPAELRFAAPGRLQQPLWQAAASLGLLLEKGRNYGEALQYYEIASGQLAPLLNQDGGESGLPAAGTQPEQRDASRLQYRIASVFRALGKPQESRRALDYALDLDPENLEARTQKRRLDAERGLL